jgi:hypothetical protein
MVPEAGIEPARPYERGILSPKRKSIRLHLPIVFPGRNYAFLAAIQPNVSAYLSEIADRKNRPISALMYALTPNQSTSWYADNTYHSARCVALGP